MLCRNEEQKFPSTDCLTRKCDHCNVTKLSEFLQEQIDSTPEDEEIMWFKWELISIESDRGKKRVTSCVSKKSSFKDIIRELENDLTKYPQHIFRARWRHKQMQNCIDQMEKNKLVMLMDYSENYRCRFQNESQNAYFDQQQVTVHPFMCYYIENSAQKQSEEELEKLFKHLVIVVSNDVKHDAFAVKVYENKALDLLKNEGLKIYVIEKFSDGAAAQYKGKTHFCNFHCQILKHSTIILKRLMASPLAMDWEQLCKMYVGTLSKVEK